jgi:hypothetical protein
MVWMTRVGGGNVEMMDELRLRFFGALVIATIIVNSEVVVIPST